MNTRFTKNCSASLVILFALASCADGFDSNEQFNGGVSNAQLESPTLLADNVKKATNADGTESAVASWPVVHGAESYKVNIAIVDDPENPEYIVRDSILDGCSVKFTLREETKYSISVLTIGNKQLNNKDALEPSILDYSTYLKAMVIPVGTEISQFVADNLPTDATEPVAFELEAGKEYHMDGVVDFGLVEVQFRGDKIHHPIVIMGENAYFTSKAGLKIQNINFDCDLMTGNTVMSLFRCSKEFDPSLKADLLGYTGGNASGTYVIERPIIIRDCFIKDLRRGILTWGGDGGWALKDVRLENNIIQLHYDATRSDKALIGLAMASGDGWNNSGFIYSLSVKNNTFFNTEENNKSYFVRYNNSSNGNPAKVFGDGFTATHSWEGNTIIRCFTEKDMGNNVQNGHLFDFNNNIFYDVFRISKYSRGTVNHHDGNNALWSEKGEANISDPTYGEIDATLDKILDWNQTMDLTKPNAGVNFKPSANCVSKQFGDPRWLE